MPRVTLLALFIVGLLSVELTAQSTEFIFSPDGAAYSDPFAFDLQNGVRGLDGPFDLDGDGRLEVLLAQHSAGGRVHVIENTGPDTWELVYSTALIDSSDDNSSVRFATAADLDGDGNWEIVTVSGNAYNKDVNPLYQLGVYVWEHDGVVGSDNYGTLPATVGAYYELDPGKEGTAVGRAQNLEASDVDGDGQMELLVASDGFNAGDIMYVLSVSGTFETDGLGTTFETWNIESRLGPRERGNLFGGGSPYEMVAADLNGDGNMDISYHAWNNYNFFNATVTGPDTYSFADSGLVDLFYKPSSTDDVALFGGTAIDIDGDGNDEVYYTNLQRSTVSVLDYDAGDDVRFINAEKFGFEIIPGQASGVQIVGSGGITSGDLDNDGAPEIIIGGPGYSAAAFNRGDPSTYIAIAEYNGGDPKDAASYYTELLNTSSPADSSGFNKVIRDSAGVVTERWETALSKEGAISGITSAVSDAIFPSGIVYMGDADEDGSVEIALSFQGVDDTLLTIHETFNADSLFGLFNRPDGAGEAGPIMPGQSYSFSFDAAPGSFFSFATMFGESNDLFYAPADTGIALWDSEGNMRSGDVTGEVWLWDAGTELNEEPFVGPNQAPRQAGPNTGEADTLAGVTLCCVDGFDYPAVSEVISVTLAADEGTGIFTVTISNVSTAEAAQKSSAAVTPLSPGVFLIGSAIEELFTEGSAASAGLEALAEDADPSILNDELLGTTSLVFFRVVADKAVAKVRSFFRVISLDGISVRVEDDRIVLPSDYKLSQNYPNPFNPSTNFDFTLPIDKKVSVKIYDVMGRLVTTLVNDELLSAGTHRVTWNGRDLNGQTVASGQYVYALEYGNFRQSRTMALVK